MPYLNIDDGMDEHPKVDALSDAAFRLYVSSKLYCARKLTDGFLPLGKARRLTATGKDATAKELIDAGLWHDLGEGCNKPECIEERTCHEHGRKGHYIVHDYLQWNHSKHWWDTRRAAETERKRKWRAAQDAAENARQTGSVTASVPPGQNAGQDVGQDVGRDVSRTRTRPDTRSIPPGLASDVDGKGFVTDLQTAREQRAKDDGFEGETA